MEERNGNGRKNKDRSDGQQGSGDSTAVLISWDGLRRWTSSSAYNECASMDSKLDSHSGNVQSEPAEYPGQFLYDPLRYLAPNRPLLCSHCCKV
jgi:hypothetical protein